MPINPTRISADAMKTLAAAGAAGNTHAAQAYSTEILSRSGGRFDHLNSAQARAGLKQWADNASSDDPQRLAAGILAAGKPKRGPAN